jgi:hypothetical protein
VIICFQLTRWFRLVRSRPRFLNRTSDFGAIHRLGCFPAVKLKPGNSQRRRSEMMRAFQLAVACLAMLVAITGQVQAAIILDFESLRHEDATRQSHGNFYAEDGFDFTETGSREFGTFGTQEDRFSGSTALFSNSIGGVITLTEAEGGTFALDSINLAELNESSVADVTFTGLLSGGGTTTQTFTLDGNAFGQETFFFDASFDSVTSVSWVQESPFHQFDDITINADSVSAVPEPPSLALFGVGACVTAIAAARRRRRQKPQQAIAQSAS